MIPYFILNDLVYALYASIAITVTILVIFGYSKALITGCSKLDAVISAFHTLLVGAVAAGSSYGIITLVNVSAPGARFSGV